MSVNLLKVFYPKNAYILLSLLKQFKKLQINIYKQNYNTNPNIPTPKQPSFIYPSIK
jgi:hypothetical protein